MRSPARAGLLLWGYDSAMKRTRRWLRAELWAGLVLLKNPTAIAPPQGWTPVQPLHAEYQFVLPEKAEEDTPYSVYLLDGAGNKVYRFECHRGGYDDTSEMTWSGDFQCALFPFKIDTLTPINVLAVDDREEQSKDWWNRGRLLTRQLQGECLQYPEYSTLRHFKLRGMDLTLGYSDIVWQGAKLTKFTLHLDVTPDADAKSPYAEPAQGPKPSKACYP